MINKNLFNVGIGRFIISNNPKDIITTYALSTCVAVIAYDEINSIGGLIHIALPDSSINIQKAIEQPGYFADTGLKIFFNKLFENGAQKNRLWIKLVGGSILYDNYNEIGDRNIRTIKEYLKSNGFRIKASKLGGSIIRTVHFHINSGLVKVKSIKVG